MAQCSFRAGAVLRGALAVVALAALSAGSCWAITAGFTDDFNDGELSGWRIGSASNFPVVAMDNGQSGTGDHSLHMASGGAAGSFVSRLIVFNDTIDDDRNWEGDWTTAGITHIEMDVLNVNADDLRMRLGMAGPGGVFGGGGGDTYITDAISVAPNATTWQHISFPVSASDWIPFGGTVEDLPAALAAVSHFRVLHNPEESFLGEFDEGQFFIDNIMAVAAAAGVLGDYNGNDEVDAADYVVWRDNPASLINEGASPNVVDQADYDFWRERFGATSGSGAGGVALATLVPEPASWLGMTGLFIFAWILIRRRV